MKGYYVYWSFYISGTKSNSPHVYVSAYSRDDALSRAAKVINNPLAYIITAEEF